MPCTDVDRKLSQPIVVNLPDGPDGIFWYLSFGGPNPDAEADVWVPMRDKDAAFKLKSLIEEFAGIAPKEVSQ